ncbi:MarR family winged helix-turn-helix transcriptional regulator [Cryptosporangium minutisporangium]|uniref:MarR family transcriptional regulator n=1 Tax=Cryptosporangium minutisporangium TaxID=113569 RepID=A0ABP6T996_9ACTN
MSADPIVDELTDLAFRITGQLRAEFNAAAAQLDLPPAQALVLVNLSGPTPMRQLAEWLSCEPSNVTGIVDGLERRGLVTRQPGAADRRVKQVVLTDEGERRRTELHSRSRMQAEALFALPDAERRQLRDLLDRVAQHSSPSCPGPCSPPD